MTPDLDNVPIKTVCPFCGRHNDQMSAFEATNMVEDGDAVMCFLCGEVAIFEKKSTRKPTAEEAVMLAGVPEIKRVRFAWLMTQQALAQGKPKQ